MSDLIDKALSLLAPAVDPDPNIHTIMRGLEKVNGVYTGEEAVVVLVKEKKPEDELTELQLLLPYTLDFGNEQVRVDVQEAPPFNIQILDLLHPQTLLNEVYAELPHHSCHSPLVPGGAQISPQAATWIGTLGVPWTWKDGERHEYGFLTNRHVIGLDAVVGTRICQPTGLSSPIGSVYKFGSFHKTDFNLIDAAICNARRNGGHSIRPVVLGLENLDPGWGDFALGDLAIKSGRTTGITQGRVVGLDARTTVGYGEHGNLRFKGQVVVEADIGQFSAPGDSGSGVFYQVDEGLWQLGGLLFAGGGNRTIINPIRSVIEQLGGEPFLE